MSLFILIVLLAADIGGHAQKGLELQQAGKFPEAIAEYRAALKQDGRQPGLLTNLGASLAHEGDYAEAIRSYQQAIAIDPTFGEARLNLGLAYYKLLLWSDAAAEFAIYQKAHPQDFRGGLLLGDSLLQLGKYPEAIAALETLEHSHSDNLGVAYVLGTAYIRNKQEDLGKPLIARIMERGDVPEVHMMMGDSYVLAHEQRKAIDEYRRALEMNQSLPLAHLRIAETTLAMGDLDGALADLQAEYAVNPNNFDLNFYLGYLHKQRGSPDLARPFLERAAAMRPETYQPNFQLALLADDRGDYTEARKRLERAVKNSPSEVEAHVVLARLYYRLKQKEEGKHEQQIIARLNASKQTQATAQHQAQVDSQIAVPVPQP